MDEIIEILSQCRPDVDFRAEKALIDDGILESLDIVMIVGELSEAFGVDITADDLAPENFNSAAAIAALIERLQNED